MTHLRKRYLEDIASKRRWRIWSVAGRRRWEVRCGSAIATTADTSSTAITLAATVIVPNVTERRRSAGWKSSANTSCLVLLVPGFALSKIFKGKFKAGL